MFRGRDAMRCEKILPREQNHEYSCSHALQTKGWIENVKTIVDWIQDKSTTAESSWM